MAPWRSQVLTIFPEMFPGPLGLSLAGKALERGLWALDVLDIRDFARDKHRSVDDTPFGGGAGMVMRPDVVDAALAAAAQRWQQEPAQEPARDQAGDVPVIYLSPRGRLLTQDLVRDLAAAPGVTLLCGRYEGVDQRVIEARRLESASDSASVYIVNRAPWPLKPRDLVYRFELEEFVPGGEMRVRIAGQPDALPVVEDYVRIVGADGAWDRVPRDERIEVTFAMHLELGSVPAVVANRRVRATVLDAVRNLGDRFPCG